MPVSSTHPEYDKHVANWKKVRDCIEGEDALRRSITDYLPVPPGLNVATEVLQTGKCVSNNRYHFYAQMAEFPEIISPTLNGMLGMVHEKPPTIELPADMKYLIDRVTPDGEPLGDFWERCTRELLTTGRFVTLGELVGDKPYLVEYACEALINWQLMPRLYGGGPMMVILHECKMEPSKTDAYQYDQVEYYRQLALEDGIYTVRLFQEIEGKLVEVPVDPEDSEALGAVPIYFGKPFDWIPLTVVNALETSFAYGPMPILPMVRRALSIFRRSADYNRSLYVKGDPQCVIFGVADADVPTEIGGSSIWAFENPEGKAMYLDIDGQGIPLMRQAIDDEFKRFADEIGMLMASDQSGYESGDALRTRQQMRQVTIKSVIINAAEGLQSALRSLGKMMGKSDEECMKITFVPNIDFTEPTMAGQELLSFINAKVLGAPISEETLHDLMKHRQVTDLTYEQERALLDQDEQRAMDKATKLAEIAAKAKPPTSPPGSGGGNNNKE